MAKKRNSSPTYRADDERMIRESFENAVHRVRDYFNPDAVKTYDLSGAVLKRRKSATLSVLPEVTERYGHYYQEESDLKSDFIRLCTSAGYFLDNMDIRYYITMAAAIWMLDELKQDRLLNQALPYFSADEDLLETISIPDMIDPSHDNLVIQAMMELIQDRDDRNDPYDIYINNITAHRKKPQTYDTVNKNPDEMTKRERFDAVMSMIRPIPKERAVKRFEEKFWNFLDIFFSQISQVTNQDHTLKEKFDNYLQKHRSNMVSIDDCIGSLDVTSSVKGSSRGNPLFADLDSMIEQQERKEAELMHAADRMYQMVEERNSLNNKRNRLITLSYLVQMEEMGELEEKVEDEDAFAAFHSFEIDDPYETCFAYLCLIEDGSDLPWTYTPALGVLLAACRKFPWTALEPIDVDDFEDDLETEYDEDDLSEEEEEEAEDEGDDSALCDLADKLVNAPIDWNDRKAQIYRLNYLPDPLYAPVDAPYPKRKLNLPQLVYGMTDVIMPRDDWNFAEDAEELVKSGMDPEFAKAMELYMSLAFDIRVPKREWSRVLESEYIRNGGVEYKADGSVPSVSDSETSEKIRQLRDELKNERSKNDELRKALYLAQKATEQQKQKAETVASTAAAERSELADLRELVYNLANQRDTPEDEADESIVSFPYSTARKTVVFGGHDTWLKIIRPMLPTVTFVNRDQNPNTDMIRGADIVWIQPNALAHSVYYKIIDIVRTHHIPISYFSWASAKKCAVQLASDDAEFHNAFF